MKTILVIVLIFIGGIQAFGQGIEFFKGDYNAALEKAKQEGKMLFVDFYVDWCGPCKRLAKDVFTLEAVGNYFNEKFVSIQIDAENPANRQVVEQNKVRSYPTLAFFDADGKLLEDPVHYRDERTKDWPQRVAQKIELHSLYVRTGNQILAINTLFQLLALQEEQPDLLRRAKHLLFIPDLLAAMLGADLTWERSIASTSQMWNPVAGTWDLELLRQMGMDPGLFGAMTDSGSIIGALPDSTKIIAVAGHDTQCAVAAMPVEEGESAAFLSCGTWSLIGCELEGKKFGVVGTGAIGMNVARIAAAFGCEVVAYSRTKKEMDNVRYVSLDELMAESDIISLHVPSNAETKGLISAEKIALMKPNAVLINTARGPVLDSQALADALNNDKIAGACIDVFETEPPIAKTHPLVNAKHTILTPHVAFASKEAMVKRAIIVFDNVVKYLNGTPQNIM